MKKKIYVILLFCFMGVNLVYASQEPSDRELTASIKKSRWASIDFLKPIIDKLEDKQAKSHQEEKEITQLKDTQRKIYQNLSQIVISPHALELTTKNLTDLYDWDVAIKAILDFSPTIPLKDQLMQNFNELGNVLQNKTAKKEPFMFLIELRDQIKKAELSKIYPLSPSQEDRCSYCHNGWTMRTKVLGDAVRECLFCGHDEILLTPLQHTLQPQISKRGIKQLYEEQFDLEVMCAEGRGIEKLGKDAVNRYTLAAKQEDVMARFNLVNMYAEGRGVEKSGKEENDKETVKLFTLAAKQGDAQAQFNLGVMYLLGRGGVPQSDKDAVKWFTKAANHGIVQAQYLLGAMYQNGRVVPGSDKDAVTWFAKAANQGHPDAQLQLGVMYQSERGVDQSDVEAAKWYTKAANHGVAQAQYNLGCMCAQGRGVLRDDTKAFKWFALAAKQGDAQAQYNLGVMYAEGRSVLQDDTKAFKWFKMAADKGFAEAQFLLGIMLANGQGVEQNCSEASKWLEMAAEQGSSSVQFNIGVFYQNGHGVPKDEEMAIKLFHLAAEKGHAWAQCNLGMRHHSGLGVPKDEKMAFEFYSLAADKGDPVAQYYLGMLYNNGHGVPKDEEMAIEFYSLAANQEHPDAQCQLGVMYQSGRGVLQDDMEAFKWFALAANQGIAQAQNNLGFIYAEGRGVEKSDDKENNDKKAVEWYRLAADQRHPDAQTNLGFMYAEGRGVEKNDKEAAKWFTLAANQGRSEAQYCLGTICYNGQGVEKSNDEAVKWFTLAANKGHANAQNSLGYLYEMQRNHGEAIKYYKMSTSQNVDFSFCNLGYCFLKGIGAEINEDKAKECFEKGKNVFEDWKKARGFEEASHWSMLKTLSFDEELPISPKETHVVLGKDESALNREERDTNKQDGNEGERVLEEISLDFEKAEESADDFLELTSNEIKQESRKLAIADGKIGPREIEEWELEDVNDEGNCFYDAVALQMKITSHAFLVTVPEGTLARDSLRLLVQGENFKDKEWADDTTFDEFVRKFDIILAIIDTRKPEKGYVYYWSDNGDVITKSPEDTDIDLPTDKPTIKLAATGNHFLSVKSEKNRH